MSPLAQRALIQCLTLAVLAIGSPSFAERLAVRSLSVDLTTATVYQRVTFDLDLDADFDNPFDSEQVAVDFDITAPGGHIWSAPGFYYQPHKRELVDGRLEKVTPTGPAGWQGRLSFPAAGRYMVSARVSDRSGQTTSSSLVAINVVDADLPGMVGRSRHDTRYFATDRGETFFPVGANVCWSSGNPEDGGRREMGTYNYDRWLKRYANAGCNYFRVWLAPHWTTFATRTVETGYNRVDLAKAWRLDHVLETAERLDMRVMMCVDSFNIAKREGYGAFDKSPFAKANGGPLNEPAQYFTNPEMLKACQDRLRYLVARYGCSTSVFAWELWNEVNLVDGYAANRGVIDKWHGDMVRHLRTVDPWGHMVTTSCSDPIADTALDAHPALDFVQIHHYMARDMTSELGACLTPDDRPAFHGEFSVAHEAPVALDPTGVHLHNGLYACVGQGRAGAPMSWWWDNYVDPQDLYPIYAAFNGWIEGFDFIDQEAWPLHADVALAESISAPTTGGLRPFHYDFGPAPFNRPTVARVDRAGHMTLDEWLPRVLHGNAAPTLRNPLTFDLDVPAATPFGLVLAAVSGQGGGQLTIHVDDVLSANAFLPDLNGPDNNEPIALKDSVHLVQLTAGKHTVRVESVGQGWIDVAGYFIPWLTSLSPPVNETVRVNGVGGKTRALVWAQNAGSAWSLKTRDEPKPVRGATATISGLAPGRWVVKEWDTRQGKTISREERIVDADGKMKLSLHDIAWDAAWKMELVGETAKTK